MTDGKKKRMSMLDSLAQAASTPPVASMLTTNLPLRSARDAVDNLRVWDIGPDEIDDTRIADRIDPGDLADLRASIETNGQTVPILVRRNPANPDRYLLVYGRRRLEAIRGSDKVRKVRALIASLDDGAALRAQATENVGRRDLSFIERALFARELVDSGYGNQSQVADVLNMTKSAVSMALGVVESVGPALARAIGPAPGVGRPRWDMLATAMGRAPDRDMLIAVAQTARSGSSASMAGDGSDAPDPSVMAFEAVLHHLQAPGPLPRRADSGSSRRVVLRVGRRAVAHAVTNPRGVRIDLSADDTGFAAWVDRELPAIMTELHARWQQRRED